MQTICDNCEYKYICAGECNEKYNEFIEQFIKGSEENVKA